MIPVLDFLAGYYPRYVCPPCLANAMGEEETAIRLAFVLRLAVLLNRGRSPGALPSIGFEGGKKSLVLSFPAGWLEEHPLTEADLEDEAKTMKKVGYELTFRS